MPSYKRHEPPVSRTRQYAERQVQENRTEARMARLEAQLEDEERRNLRLSSQILDEVALRARAERTRDDLKQELETVTIKLTEMEGKTNGSNRPEPGVRESRKRTGTSGEIADSVQRTDGSPPPESERDELPPDRSSEEPKKRPRKGNGSSRVRGNVK